MAEKQPHGPWQTGVLSTADYTRIPLDGRMDIQAANDTNDTVVALARDGTSSSWFIGTNNAGAGTIVSLSLDGRVFSGATAKNASNVFAIVPLDSARTTT